MTQSLENNVGILEARKSPRFKLPKHVQCFNESNRLLGRVMNLSNHGFMLMSVEERTVGDTLLLKVELPLKEAYQLTLRGEVVWCQQSSFSDEFGLGINIQEIDDLSKTKLNQYLDKINAASAA